MLHQREQKVMRRYLFEFVQVTMEQDSSAHVVLLYDVGVLFQRRRVHLFHFLQELADSVDTEG